MIYIRTSYYEVCFKRAENLCQTLISSGWPAIFISGSIEQTKRNFAMTQLKQFKCRILISTDLVSFVLSLDNRY